MPANRFKPSRTGDKHKGYYGNEPVKAAQGTGGLKAIENGMQVALPSPCVECPLRRDSAPGFLGGYTPGMYLELLHSPASVACHSSPGFHEGDIPKQRHCTGVSAFRANVGHICSVETPAQFGNGEVRLVVVPTEAHRSTQFIGHDEEHYFATDEEFVAHHEPGQVKK